MPLLNDDDLRAIRERFELANALPKAWSNPASGIEATIGSWADIPKLLAHAAALQEEVGRLRLLFQKVIEGAPLIRDGHMTFCSRCGYEITSAGHDPWCAVGLANEALEPGPHGKAADEALRDAEAGNGA